MHTYRSHSCADLTLENKGDTVRLSGWVHRVRDHGGVLFIDLRDHYGMTQVICDPDSPAFKDLEKVRAEWAIKEALGESAQADVEAEFDALDAYFASGGEAASWQGALAASEARNGAAPPALTGALPIEPLIVALMAAERARVAKDAKLVAECAARKDAALAAQVAIKQAALDFEGREKAEADAAEAAAEAARAAEAEAKAKEKEAKAKAKEEAATAPMKGAVQPRWLDSAQQEANGGAAPSSAGAAPVDAPAAVW